MQPREKKIGDAVYRVTMLDPEAAEDVVIDLFRLCGPTIAGIIGKLEGKGLKGLMDLQINGDVIVSALRELSSTFDKQLYREVCAKLMSVTAVSIDGKKWPRLADVQNELYRGKLQEKWKWIGFALEVNFAGFFADISSGAGPALEALAKAGSSSISHQGSDGTFGES